jgi:hypothetical protein
MLVYFPYIPHLKEGNFWQSYLKNLKKEAYKSLGRIRELMRHH